MSSQWVIWSGSKVNMPRVTLTLGEQDVLAAGGGGRAHDGAHVAGVPDVVTDQGQRHGVAGLGEAHLLGVGAREYGWRREKATGQLGSTRFLMADMQPPAICRNSMRARRQRSGLGVIHGCSLEPALRLNSLKWL